MNKLRPVTFAADHAVYDEAVTLAAHYNFRYGVGMPITPEDPTDQMYGVRDAPAGHITVSHSPEAFEKADVIFVKNSYNSIRRTLIALSSGPEVNKFVLVVVRGQGRALNALDIVGAIGSERIWASVDGSILADPIVTRAVDAGILGMRENKQLNVVGSAVADAVLSLHEARDFTRAT